MKKTTKKNTTKTKKNNNWYTEPKGYLNPPKGKKK